MKPDLLAASLLCIIVWERECLCVCVSVCLCIYIHVSTTGGHKHCGSNISLFFEQELLIVNVGMI